MRVWRVALPMLGTEVREGLEMNATWIPVGSAVGLILLSLVALEVVSEGVRVDRSSAGSSTIGAAPADSGRAFLDAPDGLVPLELAGTGGSGSAEH